MSITLMLPIFAAILWGLNYLFAEKVLEQVNPATFWLTSGLVQLVIAVFVVAFGSESFDVRPLVQPKFFWLFVATILAGVAAEFCTVYAVAGNGAAYAAFGELSYPLFIVLFGYLIYGQTGLTLVQMLGGTAVVVGAMLLTLGR